MHAFYQLHTKFIEPWTKDGSQLYLRMIEEHNIVLHNMQGRAFLVDTFFPNADEKFPLIIFCHGYKGFKDWGAWKLFAATLAKEGNFVATFNFSLNGTTVDSPLEFEDLEAFGQNNYGQELEDLEIVMDHLTTHKNVIPTKLMLIGHSRGGGIVLLKSASHHSVTHVVTLAGVSNYSNRFPKGERLQYWKEKGVYYVSNARTGQQMPHYYQFYENYAASPEKFDVEHAVKSLQIPQLIIHGSNDESVPMEEAKALKNWNHKAHLKIIEEAGHTFGAKHPWDGKELPIDFQLICAEIISFFKENS